MRTLAALLLLSILAYILRAQYKARNRRMTPLLRRDLQCRWLVTTYDQGRYVHFLPTHDRWDHTEDFEATCRCNPTIENFTRSNGKPGRLIAHRSTRAEAGR
jgi:hypothetical protein